MCNLLAGSPEGTAKFAADNAGAFVGFRQGGGFACGSVGLNTYQLVQDDGSGTVVLGSLSERCLDPTHSIAERLQLDVTPGAPTLQLVKVIFDQFNGRLLVPFRTYCWEAGLPYPTTCNDYPGGYSGNSGVFVIQGFPSAMEIFQTYTPPSGPLGFRVPAVPEGLPAADHFDTYWGNLANPIDFTQAHSLQCNYPASPPHVGDYLTVADPLPNPSAGHGYYYVTAATYQGQRRYGRKASGGRLSGRDPAVLPGCLQPAKE